MIRTQFQAILLAVAFTTLSCSVVTVAIIFTYPRPSLAEDIFFGLALASGLTFPLSLFMAKQVLSNWQLSEELSRIVSRDRLTDVATRDFFFARMDASPDDYGVSLMVDIDHFKQVNDRHGHLAGDKVIQRVAMLLEEECRAMDIVCRFGGEEFVVFLHEADKEAGIEIAERMRARIEAARISAGDSSLSVTVSIGGSMKERSDDITASINDADKALYRAKQTGRNKTVMSWLNRGIDRTAAATPA